ncbi:ABC transporter permease [Burkholderiaceae bacterium FT117]|uniref:ABC transporter permease n=1 Tax=Zeimonas sediminis TaxID=2944268 RepID=UPI002343241E|nr:ABC transporter permease [Zeimonas sediminis]MCM5572370.1 ABC transporter permease [Zeimonas sediminis]
MTPHTPPSASPRALVASLVANRGLIATLVKREVVGRYRGSMLGILWSLFNPILMLAVYTFVFSFVFKSRWIGGTGSKTEFALVLFAGLLVFNLFAECVNRSPALVLGNVNYVKKVVFPLEILPVVTLGSAMFHMLVSLGVWVIFYVVTMGLPQPTLLLLPLVIFPFALLTLGLCWFLASLGVFLRDVTQIVGVLTTVLMFMSPIFYQVDALPPAIRPAMLASPLTLTVEQIRDVMIWGRPLDPGAWAAFTLIAALVAWLGFSFFQKTRKGFADVI